MENLKNELEKVYKEYFKNSLITFSRGCFGNTLFIHCYLAKDKTEEDFGYLDNDMFNIMFSLDNKGDNYILRSCDSSYHIVPENQYLAYGRKSVSFRKTEGSAEKIIQAFNKYVKRLYDSCIEDLANNKIHNSFIDLLKTKI